MIATLDDLLHLSREGCGYFKLALQGCAELSCEEIVRCIPERRLVCRGLWNGQPVYAKLFIGSDAQRYALRDARGAQALMEAGIETPALLHQGAIAGQEGRVLVYAAIMPAQNAEQAWLAADATQRAELASALVATVARHHAAGLLQTDLYLRNFLFAGDAIYTLDGDGIRIHGALDQRRALSNLALLLSKFDVMDDARLPELLRSYAAVRGWPDAPGLLPGLQAEVWAIRRRVAQQYAQRKVLRNCSDVRVEQGFWRFVAIERAQQTAELMQVVVDPDAALDSADCRRLKNGNTCTVGLVQAGARKVVIKRYNVKNHWHGLERAMRRTRASISWSNAHLLLLLGIATPAPLALVERRCGWLRRQSYFLAEYQAGPDIAAVFADAALSAQRKSELAAAMAALLRKFCLLGIEHGDMKASNFLLVGGTPVVIDLDAMRQHADIELTQRRHARDLRRFLKNWQDDAQTLQMMKAALAAAYGNDPVLALAGIAEQGTSENT
jgi:tRNA A-37 threonylcarbamoyl transferase component Bud32